MLRLVRISIILINLLGVYIFCMGFPAKVGGKKINNVWMEKNEKIRSKLSHICNLFIQVNKKSLID